MMPVMVRLARFARDDSAAAAAEMAFVLPILLALIFGAFELGKYFMDEHVVAKAVRDGARYAARQDFGDYGGCSVSSDVVARTRSLTRTGQVSTGGTPRLGYWDNDSTVTVTVDCDTSGCPDDCAYLGIYRGSVDGAPVVTVSARVPYTPLLATLGFDTIGLTLNARSEAAVTGI